MVREEKVCCPVFNPEKWDRKNLEWDEKPFLRETMPALFHIPFPPLIGKKIIRMYSIAEKAGINFEDKSETLVLFRDPSPFRTEIYYSVTGRVEGVDDTTISGKFVTRVFDGPFNMIPKYIREMEKYLKESEMKARDYYVHYAYCPKCAEKYGHNYMILFAEI